MDHAAEGIKPVFEAGIVVGWICLDCNEKYYMKKSAKLCCNKKPTTEPIGLRGSDKEGAED